jgi:hypothetical protein
MGGAPWPGHMVHRGPAAVQTGGCWGVSVVWWPGDADEAAVEEKLHYGSAQALGEGEKRGGGLPPPPQGGPVGPHGLHRPTGQLGQKPRKNSFKFK